MEVWDSSFGFFFGGMVVVAVVAVVVVGRGDDDDDGVRVVKSLDGLILGRMILDSIEN